MNPNFKGGYTVKTKKIFAVILSLVLLCTVLTVGVNAGTVTTNWYQICETGNDLYVDGSELTATGFTSGYFGVDSCYVIGQLQRKVNGSWTSYKSWTRNSTTSWPDYVSLSETVTVPAGQYRLVTYHGVTYKGTTECTTMYSPTRTVS